MLTCLPNASNRLLLFFSTWRSTTTKMCKVPYSRSRRSELTTAVFPSHLPRLHRSTSSPGLRRTPRPTTTGPRSCS